MQLTIAQPIVTSKVARWSGRILGALAIVFLLLDGVIKVLTLAPAVDATTQLGYPAGVVMGLGLLELACLLLYLFPRTAVLGAVLLTGYLGGAIATHVRAGSDLFSMVFPLLIGLLLWGALYLVEPRLRLLLPLRG